MELYLYTRYDSKLEFCGIIKVTNTLEIEGSQNTAHMSKEQGLGWECFGFESQNRGLQNKNGYQGTINK